MKRNHAVNSAKILILAVALLVVVGCQDQTKPTNPSLSQAEILVSEGRALWETRQPVDLIASLDRFRRAAQLAPRYGPAWGGVADASALIGLYSLVPPKETMPGALEAARKALALEPDSSSTLASLGLAQYLYEWNFEAAEASFRQAIELDPKNSTVHHWYAMMLSALTRDDEAIDQMTRAIVIQPTSPLLNTKLVTILSAAGRLTEAETASLSALQRFPRYPLLQREIGFLRIRQHRFEEASEAFRESLGESSGGTSASLSAQTLARGNVKTLAATSHALARGGHRDQADRILQSILARRDTQYVPPMAIAHAFAGFPREDAAFEQLDLALEERDPGLVYLFTKPGLEQMEAGRLAKIAARIGPIRR